MNCSDWNLKFREDILKGTGQDTTSGAVLAGKYLIQRVCESYILMFLQCKKLQGVLFLVLLIACFIAKVIK